ncbi:CPBP family intramembrane metalloprotease [Hoyosella rhizosphaerae]|uniref:CAAX prenyl protease 2/Lysostaphin resistance protein A-like domain-containing protein n=1 Tax=Hoyosella rhizosphaerae TaxID=1755582 RepID=A0A916U5V2_9ACTN|nr:type II CAAX endopeptidase family protein [Hoyosella rhizosphaerae]MBN4926236.1 CPBP family intramembrane metalloprotease [Hoyosella rhizosphaerae]GGC61007.1 hypothetical protein GCM10011410_11850 [Hoyosella rhizosphaerae]
MRDSEEPDGTRGDRAGGDGASSDGASSHSDGQPPVPPDWWYPHGISRFPRAGNIADSQGYTGSPNNPDSSERGGYVDTPQLWGKRTFEPRRLETISRSHRNDHRWARADRNVAERANGQKWGLGAAFAVLLVNLLGFVVAAQLVDIDSPLIIVAVIAPTFLAAVVAVLITVVRGNGPMTDFGLPRTMNTAMQNIGVGLAFGTASVIGGLFLVLGLIGFSDELPTSPLEQLGDQSLNWRIALAMWIWLGAPVAEELIFRGIVWGALDKQRFASRWVNLAQLVSTNWSVLIITALVFGLWHLEPWRLGILVFAGLMFGLARLYTGSVLGSMVAHSVNNALPAMSIIFLPMALP